MGKSLTDQKDGQGSVMTYGLFPGLELWLVDQFSYAGRVKILDPDLVVIQHLLRSSGPSGFESHSLDACFHSSVILYMVYANLFITYTTPIIKLSAYHASYAITSRHAALTANEYENPRPKHGRACLSPRVFLDAIFHVSFLIAVYLLLISFLVTLHYTVVIQVHLSL
jgi:hypothetical protein